MLGTIDMEKLEAAVRRLCVLPERQGDIPGAVGGLAFVIKLAPLNEGYASAIERSDADAARELRAAHRALYDFTRAWCGMSATAREALDAQLRARPNIDIVALISHRAAHVVDAIPAAADDLDTRGRSRRGPKAKRPPLHIARHAAKVYEHLTGEKPPGGGVWTRGSYYEFLENVYKAAGIDASAEHYAKEAIGAN